VGVYEEYVDIIWHARASPPCFGVWLLWLLLAHACRVCHCRLSRALTRVPLYLYLTRMSRKYKFHNKEGLHFVSFATVYWVDVFVREPYIQTIIESLDYCRKNKGLEVYCWCIMPSHVHLIIRAKENNPETVLGRFKEFTSKKLQQQIADNAQESRREWMSWMFKRAGAKSSNVKHGQFWQHHNKPIEIYSQDVWAQKMNYIHFNPVIAGFVNKPEDWKYSSAGDYSGGKGLLEMDFV